MALKFITHFQWISIALNPPDSRAGLWDDEEGFYYDVMRMPDGDTIRLKVRSLVGLLPLCAATVFDADVVDRNPAFMERVAEFNRHFADAAPSLAHPPGPSPEGHRLIALVDEPRLRRILAALLDEDEFLGPHGIRSISRRHLEAPCEFDWAGQRYSVHYLPAESDTGMFGGNSNWRGPVWFPMNLVILRGLIQLHGYYGERLKVECPTGSGRELNLLEVAEEIAARLASDFTEDGDGRRPVFGGPRAVPERPALARPAAVPRVLPRRQRRRPRGEPPDRLDRHRRAAADARGLMRLPPRPTIYEINTAVWLERLGGIAWPRCRTPTGTRWPRSPWTPCG